MGKTWQLQDAKNRLSEVIEEAVTHGPQVITRRGVETAVVIGYEEYRRLEAKKQSLTDFFRQSPLYGVELNLTRDRSPLREDIAL